jgi:hypothetical protein
MNHQTDRNRPRSGRHTITLRAAVERRRPAGRTAAGRRTAGRYQWQSPTPGASPLLACRGFHRVWTRPPSMEKSAPVTLPVLSLASSSARSATSSGRVKRPVTASAAALAATSPGLTPAA